MRRKILILLTTGMVIIGVGAAALAEGGKIRNHGGGAIGAGLFNWLDANTDGVVTQDEVSDMRGPRFDRFDANGDGTVTKAELEQVLQARLDRMRDRILKRFDANRDGLVTRQEYDAKATHRFTRFDRDNDGRVTRQEFDVVRADWQALRGRMHKMGAQFWKAPAKGPEVKKE